MTFKNVGSAMKGPISEAHPDYDKLADSGQKMAVEAARRGASRSEEEAHKEIGAAAEIRAKFKIEVRYVTEERGGIKKGRTTHGPNLVGIMIWESGRRFHGGGDDKMYWCKDNRNDHDEGCWSPISSDHIRGGIAVCPNCNQAINANLLTDIRIFRTSTQSLAGTIEKIFRQLHSNADIYCKYDKDDIRFQSMAKERGWEAANRLKGMHIYPLKNLIKDTASGADLTKRIFAFLCS